MLRLFSKNPSVTLIGHGYLGVAIARALDVQGLRFNWLHHTQDIVPAEVIINATGYVGHPNLEACEMHKEETIRANILFPLRIARYNCYTIHLMAGCIFEGNNHGSGWSERDMPNFSGSFYALSKMMGEEALEPYHGKSCMLRICTTFSGCMHPMNLLSKLDKHPKLIDSVNSLTNVEDAARVIVWSVLHRPTGIYNLANPGRISIRDIAHMMGMDKPWLTQDDLNRQRIVPRSTYELNTDKLQAIFPMRTVHEAMEESVASYKRLAG